MQDIALPGGLEPIIMTYRWFAKVYGFTPDQVDELPLGCLTWWPEIENAEAKAVERKQKQEASRAKMKRGY